MNLKISFYFVLLYLVQMIKLNIYVYRYMSVLNNFVIFFKLVNLILLILDFKMVILFIYG